MIINIDSEKKFGAKEVPDIFFVKDNEIFYYMDTVAAFRANLNIEGKWDIKIRNPLFQNNINFLWETTVKNFDIYCCGFKREKLSGEDSEFILKFPKASLCEAGICFYTDGEPCNFPMRFQSEKIEIIKDSNYPRIDFQNNEKVIIFNPIKK